jgi:hypothetical protein
MFHLTLADLIFLSGWFHLATLTASAQVPRELRFREDLPKLNPLLRQWVLVAGIYIVFNIVAFGIISLCFSKELAAGTPLARAFCAYVSLFWGLRLLIQCFVFDAKLYLTKWYLRIGYYALTGLFVWQTMIYGYAALRSHG